MSGKLVFFLFFPDQKITVCQGLLVSVFFKPLGFFLFQGVLAGTSKCFYAFIGNFYKKLYFDLLINSNNLLFSKGFDAIATTGIIKF